MSGSHDALLGFLPSNIKVSGFHIQVSAPGKVILHGEHSVVYGKLAVAAALGLRSTTHLVEIQMENALMVDFPSINFSHKYDLQEINKLLDISFPVEDPQNFNWEYPEKIRHEDLLNKCDGFIKISFQNQKLTPQQMSSQRAIFYLLFGILGSVDVHFPSVFIHANTQLQIGAGTGSSASFLVSLSALIIQYVKMYKSSGNFSKSYYKPSSWKVNLKDFSKKELGMICNWAFNAEKIIHGTPSGIDNTICTYGSMVEFRKGLPLKLIPVRRTYQILLVNTKVSRDTKTLVAKVAQKRQNYPKLVDHIFDAMEEIALIAVEKIKTISQEELLGDDTYSQSVKLYEELTFLSSVNHNLLASLGVSHCRLDEIIQILSQYGLHGKLTGAGGGGYAIALVPPFFNKAFLQNVQEVLSLKGFEVTCVGIGGKGVAIE